MIGKIQFLGKLLFVFSLALFVSSSVGSANEYAYVTNSNDNTVSVIDVASNVISQPIPVGGSPENVAFSPDGRNAYITNWNEGSVSVIDSISKTASSPILVGTNPYGIAVSADGVAYVSNWINSVSVIDMANNEVKDEITTVDSPMGIAVSPDGKKIYVSSYNGMNTVSVIETESKKILSTILVGESPRNIVVSPDGSKVYVINEDSYWNPGTVSVIDADTNKINATILVGHCPERAVVAPDGKKVFVANYFSDTVSVINAETNEVANTINVGSRPSGVAITSDGKKVFVTNAGTDGVQGTVSVIDVEKNEILNTLQVGNRPTGISIAQVPDESIAPNKPPIIDTVVTATDSLNPTISWTYIDADNNPQVQYELEVTTGPFGTGVKMWSQSQSSMYSSVKYGGYALTNAGSYYVRVRAFDGSDWSEWSEKNIHITVTTKKVAVILAKFSDSGTISSPDVQTVKDRCNLIQKYYQDQSYGSEHIAFEVYSADTSDGWYQLDDGIEQGKNHLAVARDKTEWYAACNKAGVDASGYDTVMVVFPVDFSSYAWLESPYTLCNALEGYGNWAHELGHSLYGLEDKYSSRPTEGDIGEWGIMGFGWKYNPPAPVIGFDREKKDWLDYKDISESNIDSSGSEYVIYTLSDTALKDEGLLRLETSSSNSGCQYVLFEGRKRMDDVIIDPSVEEHYPFTFGVWDEGIEIYDIDVNKKIWREPASSALVSIDPLYYMNLNMLGVTIFPGQSKKIDGGRLKATCYLNEGQLKLKIERSPLENIKIYYVNTANFFTKNIDLAEEDGNLDVDLHMKTSEGKEVGMDYSKNTYVVSINNAETSGNLMGGGPEWISVPDDVDVQAFVTISPDLKALLESDPAASVEVSTSLEVYDENGNLQETTPFSFTISDANLQDGYELPSAPSEPEPVLPVADFTANVTDGHHPLDVQFMSISTDVNGFQWNFGDGSENATIANPLHTFESTGIFNVVLTVSNDNGTSSKNMDINVTKSASELKDKSPVADFRADERKGVAPLKVNFTDASEHAPTEWTWDFGDGSESSHDQNPTHIYEQTGNYTVNLTVGNEVGTDYKVINQFIKVED